MKYFLIAILIFSTSVEVLSQTACTQTLRRARTVYDEGRIQEMESLLEGCIKNGFTDEERTEAYRLLILSYLYLDEPEKADNAMLALLRDNPEFRINQRVDPAELINLYRTFRTDPIFYWGLKADATYTLINVIESYALYDQNTFSGEYTPNISIGGTAFIEKDLFFEGFRARFELSYTTTKFTHTATFLSDPDNGGGIASPEMIETQTWIGSSLMGQYKVIKKSSWNPYVTLGPSVYYLLASDLAAETAVENGEQATGTSLDLIEKEMRESINLAASLGVGVKKKLGGLYFTASARYSYGLVNITSKHYDNELSLKYGSALNDISTGIASFSLGIIVPKYSPKKLTSN